jgi:tetratricopeptide (TPR) repeat protein
VLNIIKHNGWQRPIYFAATVSPEAKLGLDSNLVMEGMVYRLLEHGRPQDSNLPVAVNVDRTIQLIENVYRFRGVVDSSVRKTHNARRLLTNYARVFSLTGRELLRRGEAAQARKLLDTATEIVPEDPASRYFRAIALQLLGETDKAVEDFLHLAESYPDLIIQQARNFATQGQPDVAEMLLTRYLSNNQSNAGALALLHAIRSGEAQLPEPAPAPQRPADS